MDANEAATPVAAQEGQRGDESWAQRPKRMRVADARAFISPEAQVELAEKKQTRAEDKAWREKVRAEDAEARKRTERNARLYSALDAAARTAKSGASAANVIARADQFLDWLKTHAREQP